MLACIFSRFGVVPHAFLPDLTLEFEAFQVCAPQLTASAWYIKGLISQSTPHSSSLKCTELPGGQRSLQMLALAHLQSVLVITLFKVTLEFLSVHIWSRLRRNLLLASFKSHQRFYISDQLQYCPSDLEIQY